MKEPFINHMFPGIRIPWEHDFEERDIEVVIYKHKEYILHDDEDYYCYYCDKPDCNEECEDALEDVDDSTKPLISGRLENLSIQNIIDALPSGQNINEPHITLNDVKISLSYNDWGGRYYHTLTFFYKKHMPADPEGFKAAKEKYDECYRLYEIERAKYEKWQREQKKEQLLKQIQDLENEDETNF